MHYIEGSSREQIVLFTESLDTIIGNNNPVRIIDAYIENINMGKLKFRIHALKTGAPPYRPQLLLKIYIYGYMEKIRTSRRLEKECQRNKELQWLTEGLSPDFKTIADFRKDNREGLKNIFKEFLLFCKKMNLIDLAVVGIDGTKLRAQNSMNNIYKRKTIDEVSKKIEEKIEEYLSILDKEDKSQAEELKIKEDEVTEIVKRLKNLQKYSAKVKEIKKKFEEDKELQTYLSTDPDSRLQSDKGKIRAGYNPQIIVDSKHNLIVGAEVTNQSNDIKQLEEMTGKLKELKTEMEVETTTEAVLDAGYHSEEGIMKTKGIEGISVVVSDPKESKVKKGYKISGGKEKQTATVPTKNYNIDKFKYDSQKDIYICPAGKVLRRKNKKAKKEGSGREVYIYQSSNCSNCEYREFCTKSKKGRAVKRSVNAEEMEKYNKQMQERRNKELLKKRKEMVEHPFGTIKRNFGYTYFEQKGIEKVTTEFKFMGFVYNFKRVINILGRKEFIELLNKEKTVVAVA